MRKSPHRPVNGNLWLQALCSRLSASSDSQQQVATSNASTLIGREMLALSFDVELFELAGHTVRVA